MVGGASGTQYFSLRWNNHPVNLVSVFTGLYQAESLVDVSLAAEGRHLQAHKVVLSACSEYFQALFSANPCQHPIVILKDVAFEDLQTVVKFMYHGIVNVSSDKLPGVLKTADALQIKGLEKNNDLLSPYLGPTRLLSVPSHQTRQPSTESLPEYLLQRSRSDGGGYFPQRAHSAESRGYSFDSGPLEVSRQKRLLSPPGSPTQTQPAGSSHARKKFRQASGTTTATTTTTSESASTETVEGEEVKTETIKADSLSPCPEFSPDTEHIAKKKRAMFQARKNGSGSGSRSSELQNSCDGRSDKENKQMDTSMSSSISHSSDREEVDRENTLQVPQLPHPRTLVRAVSATELHHSALATKFKRGRFLKRQQCQDAAEESEGGITRSEPPPSPPTITVDSTALVEQQPPRTHPFSQSPHHHPHRPPSPLSRPDTPTSPIVAVSPCPPPAPHTTIIRQPSLDPLCGLESLPLLYSSSGPPGPRLSPSSLLRPLPAVRVIPEADPLQADDEDHHQQQQHHLLPHHHHHHPPHSQQQHLAHHHHHQQQQPHQHPGAHLQHHSLPGLPSPSLLYAGVAGTGGPYEAVSPPHHHHQGILTGGGGNTDRKSASKSTSSSIAGRESGSSVAAASGQQQQHHQPPTLSSPNRGGSQQQFTTMEQFGHCPKAREGPALSCNYCWNTSDGSGRILRRKTKYHCPECQTNLCIVPCFQQFHEALEAENQSVMGH